MVGFIYFLVITVHKFEGIIPSNDKEKMEEENIEDEEKLSNSL